MVEPPRDPARLRRRDALRLLAASAGAVAGGSLIVSAPAHADVGSEPCLFAFSGSPGVTISAFNTQIIGDFITLTMGVVSGRCDCGGTPTIQYAFHLVTPLTTASTPGWIPNNQVSLSFANLWPAAGGPFTVSAGVRVTCAGPSGTTIRCRYASATFDMPASFGQVNTGFSLSTNNGNSAFPNLPACDVAALRMAALRTESLGLVPGPAATPPELQALIAGAPELQPVDVLAEPLPPAPESAPHDGGTETPEPTRPSDTAGTAETTTTEPPPTTGTVPPTTITEPAPSSTTTAPADPSD